MKAKLLFFMGLCIQLLSAQDTTVVVIDTLSQDSSLRVSLGVPISKDSLDAAVIYNADGYIKFDVISNKIHLYENAFVAYTSITLKAAHIELDWANNIVLAEGMINDSTGLMDGLPEFADGDNTFTADKIRYNFETRKGIIYDAVSSQDDIQIHSSRSKFISAAPGDSTAHDIIYSEDATFSTCTADEPHFAIRSKRQKIIPGKRVIVGPSNLEIMNIPTPLWLPFGFFPISEGRSTGLIFPRDYEYSEQFGFGLKNFGWFFPIGDHVNLTLTGDYYLQGSFGLGAAVQYRKRYGYNGQLRFSFDSRNLEEIVDQLDANGEPILQDNGLPRQESIFRRANGFSVNWTHNQDIAAHPLNKLGGSIQFQTNDFARRVRNDAQSVNTNVINSNFTFSRNWQDKPISMSLAFRHSQNTQTRKMNVDFPTFNFQTQTVYPFRKKERVGAKKWFEDITFRYTNEARANFTAADTSFFEQATLDDARYGMKQDVATGTSIKLLKYFNLNPTARYTEVWYAERLNASFIDNEGLVLDTVPLPNGEFRVDTIDYGRYDVKAEPGFSSYRTYSASLSLNTQVFGTLRFKKGFVRGLRHVMKPSISMGFQPNYRDNENYYNYLRDTTSNNDLTYFSRFREGIFGTPPQTARQASINYNITNILEAKIFSRKDSTERNIKLFDNIYIKGNYNFALDSVRWSPVVMTGTTRLFKGASTFTFRANFDPHVREQKSATEFRRLNITTWQANKKPFEFVNATFRLTTNLTVAKIRAMFQGKEEKLIEEVDQQGVDVIPVEETDFLSLFENFSIRHNLAFAIDPVNMDRDTFTTTIHSIELQGSLALTPNWNVDIGSIGYDFISKSATYPYLGLSRDLHCWEMGFNWAPTRNTYTFFLRVKPGTLDFLKVPYQRNNVDGADPFR